MFIIFNEEFGLESLGKFTILRRALYDGKATVADYWKYIRKYMLVMNFESYKDDPDVSYRPGTKDNSSTYYQYVLLYTYDILYNGEHPKEFILNEICEMIKGPKDIFSILHSI